MRALAIAFVDDLKDAGECFRVGVRRRAVASGRALRRDWARPRLNLADGRVSDEAPVRSAKA